MNVMNERLVQMRAEIEKLKCADVSGLAEEKMSEKADWYADKFSSKDLPKIDREAFVKHGDESTQRFGHLPFSGSKEYFGYSVPGGLSANVERIEPGQLVIPIEGDAAEADNSVEQTINAIEGMLARMQQDCEKNFPREKFKELAQLVLTKKRDSCAKLKAAGFSVR